MRLLHVSDTHFGTERPQVVQALQRLAHALRPDVVVMSGDITQRARREQFDAARAFVDGLQAPRVLTIPGNHDIPLFNLVARAAWPYANFLRVFGEVEPSFESPELLVLAVKTTRRYRHKNGEVSPTQIERVASRLQSAGDGQLRVVVVHQPIDVPREKDEHDRLRGHSQAAQRWSDAGADLVLGGHIHLPYVLPLHQRMRGLKRHFWAVQAGTALSHRVREGISNSVNVIRWRDGSYAEPCVVERWDYASVGDAFAKVNENALEIGGFTAPR